MAEFTVNPHRHDPYKDFKFRVKWDGRYVAGVSRVGALQRRTEVIEYREGGAPNSVRKSPGITTFAPITFERGRTHDPEFERWANKVWHIGGGLGGEASLEDFRKDVIIDFFNEAGQLALRFVVYRCWPSEYVALPELDGNGDRGVAMESLTLENEGWERDLSVVEPAQPSFDVPA